MLEKKSLEIYSIKLENEWEALDNITAYRDIV